MECEICGREIKGRSFNVIVESSELKVCAGCKEFGTENIQIQHVKLKRKSKPIEFTEELLENYNLIVRREREKRGWSQEVLAKKIHEKESLIRKVENAEITPELEVTQKLEKLFNIRLREKVSEVKVDFRGGEVTPTLGDVAIIKKRKLDAR
jgi:putative transcription factor